MDYSEEVAEKILLALDLGSVIYEPNGPSTAPDFRIGNDVNVEVSRLTKSVNITGNDEVIEKQSYPLCDGVNNSIEKFRGLERDWTKYVSYRFRRPFSRQDAVRKLRTVLSRGIDDPDSLPDTATEISPNFWVRFKDGSPCSNQPYLLGMTSDLDAAGWVLPDLLDNVPRIAASKRQKLLRCVPPTQRNWLMLSNFLFLSLADEDVKAAKLHLNIHAEDRNFWEKIILFNPTPPFDTVVLWDKRLPG